MSVRIIEIHDPNVNNAQNRLGRYRATGHVNIKDILIWMLSLTMLVDFANGLLPGLHIGELFRVMLLMVCTALILKRGRKEKNYYLLLHAFLIFNVVFSSLVHGGGLVTNISMALKTCIFFAVYFSLIILNKRRKIKLDDIDQILLRNLYYAPALFIASYVFGIGRSSYSFGGQNLGFKSVFLSLNSVNVVLLILYINCIDNVFEKKQKKWAFFALYVAVPMAMLGTKTGYAMIAAIPFLFLLLRIKKKRTWEILFVEVMLIAVFARPFIQFILPRFQGIIDRQRTLYQSRSFWTYLTSTRNLRVHNIMRYFFVHANPMEYIFGSGYYWIHNVAAGLEISSGNVIPIEMDWADLLVTYGFTGMIATYMFVIKRIIVNKKARKTKGGGSGYFWNSLILLLYGTFAGHLFFEAISSTFYAITIAGLVISENSLIVTDIS